MGRPPPAQARRDRDLVSPGWDDLAIFHAIASRGSLAMAAEQLGLSEATVARRIKALEASLGVPLFTRGPNRLLMTPIGRELAQDVSAVAAAVERFSTRARSARALADAPVRITATTSISLFLTMHATTISAAAGGIEIVIISTRDRLDLSRGDADIAVRMRKPPEEPGYFGQKVGRLTQALYIRKGIDPATAPVISVSRETSSRIDDYITQYAAGRPVAARVGDSAARYESIRSAGAVSMAPCFMADADASLVRLAPPPEHAADEIFLVSHDVSRQRPAVVAVMAALRKVFRSNRAKLDGLTKAA